MSTPTPNPHKQLAIDIAGVSYLRIPLRTHLITDQDNIFNVVDTYTKAVRQLGDIIFVSERAVAITQGRAFPIADIHPSRLATFLSRRVYRSPYGIGLGSPWTMELAIREAGLPRIFLGMVAALVTKPFGIRGMFYRVVGNNINAIDGPCDYTLPPYNKYAKLGPKDPQAVARSLAQALGIEVVIVDANDLGVAILGKSTSAISDEFAKQAFRDNPLGQTNEQTPLCLVRRAGV